MRPRPEPRPPGVARVDEPDHPAGVLDGPPEERRHRRVAADDPDEGHDVGRLDLRRERHEVALAVDDPIAEAAPLGLATGDRHEGR